MMAAKEVSYIEISKKIYLLRTESDLTQSEFAKIAGATDKAVSSWENGTRSPKVQYTRPICEYFGIDLNTFVDESNDVYKPGAPAENKIKPVGVALDELDRELLQLCAHLTPEQKRRQIETLRDIVGRKDN